MTEKQWLRADDPQEMLTFLGDRLSERKARLFAVAGCRLVWSALEHPHCRSAVEVAERFADGRATRQLRARRYNQVMGVTWSKQPSPSAAQATYNVCAASGQEAAVMVAHLIGYGHPEHKPTMADLLRCVAGNPFHPVVVSPAVLGWEAGTVGRVASEVYEERAFDRAGVLADALDDAGADAVLIEHLRDGTHVRGCWVVDLALGKR